MLASSWFLSLALASAAPNSPLETGSHCVAYRAHKTAMLIVNGDDIVGKNCDISAQVLPDVGGLYHIEVIVPIRSFQSGDKDRDDDVIKVLKADVQPEMTFRSKAMTAQQWRELFEKKDFDVPGEIVIAKKTFPLTLSSHYIQSAENAEVDGMASVKFKDFDITPPSVAGGLVAKTKPELELHFHLLASRILGADSIRLGKAPDPLAKDQQ